MRMNEIYRTLKVLFSNFDTAFSFNSVVDSSEVLYDAWRDCSFSLAMLVYIDNDRLNIYDRLLEQLELVRT